MADSSPYQRIEQRMRDTKQQRVDEDTAIANFIQRQVLEIGSQKAAKLAEHTKKADEQEWELTNEEQASTDALLAKHLKDAEELFARHKAELEARNRASQQTLWVLAETNKAAKKKHEQEFEKEEALVRAGLKYKKEELNRARAVEDAKDREEVYNFLTAQANSPLPAAQTGQQTARPSSPLGNGFESSISPFDIQPSTVNTSNASSPSHIAYSGPATPLPSSPLRSIEIGDAVSMPSTRSALIVTPDRSSAPSPEPTPESAKLNMSTTAVMTRITSTMMSPSPRRCDIPRREAVCVNIESPIILDRRGSGSKHLMDDQPAGDRRSPAARVASPATPRVQTTPITKPSVSRLLDFSQDQTPVRTAPSKPSPERVNPRLAMQLYQVRYDLIDGGNYTWNHASNEPRFYRYIDNIYQAYAATGTKIKSPDWVIAPHRVWNIKYSTDNPLIYINRGKSNTAGKHMWVSFMNDAAMAAFLQSYREKCPNNQVSKLGDDDDVPLALLRRPSS